MKKLLSIAAVAAIVTSAFAFTTKGVAVFCLRNAAGTACQVVNNKHIDPNGVQFLEYPLAPGSWDGQAATCTGIGNCSQAIKLTNN
jgi:hypothetical protein